MEDAPEVSSKAPRHGWMFVDRRPGRGGAVSPNARQWLIADSKRAAVRPAEHPGEAFRASKASEDLFSHGESTCLAGCQSQRGREAPKRSSILAHGGLFRLKSPGL